MPVTAEEVIEVLAEETNAPREALVPSATLEALGIASLDVISALFALEDRFGVVVEQEDVKDCRTLQDFIDVTIAKSEAAAGA